MQAGFFVCWLFCLKLDLSLEPMRTGMKRKVKGIINKADSTPWEGATIVFALYPGSYDQDAFYPDDSISVVTDETGAFTIDLWCNEDGVNPSVYGCTINHKENFTFTLPHGTEDIDLSVLRSLGVSPFPTPSKPKLRDHRDIFVPSSGQVQFPLRQIPAHPHLSLVWLNGVKILYPTDYIVDGSILVCMAALPRLESTDVLEIVYYTGV